MKNITRNDLKTKTTLANIWKKIFQVQKYQGTGELKNFQSSKSSTQITNQSMFKYNQGTSQMSIIYS